VTWLRVLRIIKTLKLLRVIRVMRFFQVLRLMISSIAGSMMTLLWSIVMISIMMFMFGLCFLNAITIYLNEHQRAEIDDLTFEGIEAYWSSVPQSMATLFWTVTGGADWEPLAQPIRMADGIFYALFFFYVAFAAFAVLNVLTGMFVDTAMQVAAQDEENVVEELLTRKEIENFRAHVEEKLSDTPGFITLQFVKDNNPDKPQAARDAKAKKVTAAFQRLLEIEHDDMIRVFGMMDPDGAELVNLDEYIKGCCHAKGNISGLDMVLLMNETKHVNKQLVMAVDFLEERFNEMLFVSSDASTAVETWQHRRESAKKDPTIQFT